MSTAQHPRHTRHRHRSPRPRSMGKARVRLTMALLVLPVVLTLAINPTWSAFLATTTNTGTTFAAAASFPTYPTSVTAGLPWAYYRSEESAAAAATLAAADSSGNANPGTYNGVTNGPATFWKFEENTGSTAGDSSGAVNTGTLASSPTWTTGNTSNAATTGNALGFNGTSQYVNGARAAVKTNTSFSVAAWVYLTAKGTARTAVSQDGTNIPGFWLQYNITSDRWAFAVGDSDSTGATLIMATGTSSPTVSTWYHLTGVYDSVAQQIKLYVDGSLQGTTAFTTPWSATGVLAVGRAMWSGANGDYWPGTIDEVRLYQRALTAAEALSLGNGLPVVDWELSEGAGTPVADRGTAGYTRQLVSGASWTTSGHDGNAVSFDGTSGRVTGLNGSTAVATNTSFSVAAWVFLTDKTSKRTAVSQNGINTSGFFLEYDSTADRWAFSRRASDAGGSALSQALGTASPTLSTWYHLVGVYDSVTQEIKLYVNGSGPATTAFTTPWSATGVFAVGRAQTVGGALGQYWHGRIDTVKAYKRTLSDTEVTNLYTGAAYTETDMTAALTGALQGTQQGQEATTAVAYAGRSNGYGNTTQANPTTFTIDCWFRTASTTGGLLVGFGDAQTGVNTSYDRHLYLDSGNKITFGVSSGGYKTVRSTATYNDGAWHHVAASLGAAGQKLYVDGALVASDAATTTAQNYTGYWRWGGGTLTSWTNAPSTGNLTGTIDEVAVYPSQLTDQQIARRYAANH